MARSTTQLQPALVTAGLNRSAARLYCACLARGTASRKELSKSVRFSESRTRRNLNILVRKRLVKSRIVRTKRDGETSTVTRMITALPVSPVFLRELQRRRDDLAAALTVLRKHIPSKRRKRK